MSNEAAAREVRWQEAMCPDCNEPATSVSGYGGWRFRCAHCECAWGHPQLISYEEALQAASLAEERRCATACRKAGA